MDEIVKNQDFRTPVEELAELQRDLTEIRTLLREVTAKISQIERHVWRAFPTAKPAKTAMAKKAKTNKDQAGGQTLAHDTALKFFDTLRHTAEKEGNDAMEKRLSELSMADVRFLSQELGLPSGSKLSRKKLYAGITGRLNESMLLSKNINVTPSRSEQETQQQTLSQKLDSKTTS